MGVDYISKLEVRSFADLKPADHIAWKKAFGLSWDHALVESVRAKDREMTVLHYTLATKESYKVYNHTTGRVEEQTRGAGTYRVERTVVKERDRGENLYILQEKLGCFFSPEVVLEKAKQRLGEQNYNILTNTDEDFVVSCRGEQIRRDYASRSEVESFKTLSPGDHVAWIISPGLPMHHALVDSVCPEKKEITIIHYTEATDALYLIHNNATGRDELRTRGSEKYRVETMVVKKGERLLFKLVEYVEHHVDMDEALRRAWLRLGEQEYNALTNDGKRFVLDCRGCKMEGWQDTAKRVGTVGALVLGGAALAVAAPALIVGALGFGSGGVVAGSAAAGMMSAAGNVAAGSAIATMQSVGAAGLAASTQVALATGGAAAGAATAAALDNARKNP